MTFSIFKNISSCPLQKFETHADDFSIFESLSRFIFFICEETLNFRVFENKNVTTN